MSDSVMSDQELRALVYLLVRQRPSYAKKWDEEGTFAHVARLRDRGLSRETITDRAFKTAWDKTAETPGRMANAPKFDVTPTEDSTPRPAKREDECRKHPGQWPGSCGPCATEKFQAFHDEQPETPRVTVEQAKAEARAAIEATRLARKANAEVSA